MNINTPIYLVLPVATPIIKKFYPSAKVLILSIIESTERLILSLNTFIEATMLVTGKYSKSLASFENILHLLIMLSQTMFATT